MFRKTGRQAQFVETSTNKKIAKGIYKYKMVEHERRSITRGNIKLYK
jgi:hypothetical protein